VVTRSSPLRLDDDDLALMTAPTRRTAALPDLLAPGDPRPDFRARPEDFVVEELADPTRSGPSRADAPWLRLSLSKRGMTTPEAIGVVAGACHIERREFGYAGMKDKWAETRQWISAPRSAAAALARFRHPKIELGAPEPWSRPLRRGELLGNRFVLTLRGLVPDALARARAKLERLDGRLDNHYGPQRFGHERATLLAGLDALAAIGQSGSRRPTDRGKRDQRGKRGKRDAKLELALNAAQAGLFHLYAE